MVLKFNGRSRAGGGNTRGKRPRRAAKNGLNFHS